MSGKIVCLGDSLTYGYGVSKLNSWVEKAARQLNTAIDNEGVNGDTTALMLARFYEDVISKRPELVMIMGGSNDILQGTALSFIMENIQMMADKAKAAGVKAVIGIPLNIEESLLAHEWYLAEDICRVTEKFSILRERLLEYAVAAGIDTIDFQAGILQAHEAHQEIRYYLDGLHPTKEGHEVMADIFCDYMKRRRQHEIC